MLAYTRMYKPSRRILFNSISSKTSNGPRSLSQSRLKGADLRVRSCETYAVHSLHCVTRYVYMHRPLVGQHSISTRRRAAPVYASVNETEAFPRETREIQSRIEATSFPLGIPWICLDEWPTRERGSFSVAFWINAFARAFTMSRSVIAARLFGDSAHCISVFLL